MYPPPAPYAAHHAAPPPPGHTYWLYKDTESDVVRLYDLTELCETNEAAATAAANAAAGTRVGQTNAGVRGSAAAGRQQNPFSHPVAMLLFRIAARMYTQIFSTPGADDSASDTATICSLLRNVLKLLDSAKHPQVAANASYMLAGVTCRPENVRNVRGAAAMHDASILFTCLL